jgi:hypothetical protein
VPSPDLIPLRGAIAEPLTLEVLRNLTPEDLSRAGDAPKVNVPILKKLRAIHHRQAQLLAQGRSPTQVATIVGCTVQRLVQLQRDPSFSELVAQYQDSVMVQALEDGARLRDKIVDVGEMAVDELRDRLEDPARLASTRTGELRKIAEFAMDRTVAPPKAAPMQTNPPTAVTINFGTTLRRPPPTIDLAPEPARPDALDGPKADD